METVTDFIFLGSKITVDGDQTHEIRRCLHLGRKAMTNLDSIIKKIFKSGFLNGTITIRFIHDCSHEIKNSYDKPGQCIKKERHHFADKSAYS